MQPPTNPFKHALHHLVAVVSDAKQLQNLRFGAPTLSMADWAHKALHQLAGRPLCGGSRQRQQEVRASETRK